MSKEQSKEYAEQLKISAKELIDGIGTDGKEEQIRKINEILDTIAHPWILEQIYRFCINMTKEE